MKEWKSTSDGEDDDERMNCNSPVNDEGHNSEDDDVVQRPKKPRKPVADLENSESESDLDDLNVDDTERVMRRLPDNPASLLDFTNSVQGILLLLVLKQHLKNQYGFSDGYALSDFSGF